MSDTYEQVLTLRAVGGKYYLRTSSSQPWLEISAEVWEVLRQGNTPGYPPEES